jgi:hypothetical protein
MFTPQQYRAKAVEYGDLVKTSTSPNEKREFQELEKSFGVLADNEQWLVDNYNETMHAPEQDRSNDVTLAGEEEYVPHCDIRPHLTMLPAWSQTLACVDAPCAGTGRSHDRSFGNRRRSRLSREP